MKDPIEEMREFVLRVEGQHDGMAWMGLLLEKHSRVLFELQWMVFMLAQVAGFMEAVKENPARADEAREMLAAIEEGCNDLEEAAAAVTKVARDILSNSQRNLEKMCP